MSRALVVLLLVSACADRPLDPSTASVVPDLSGPMSVLDGSTTFPLPNDFATTGPAPDLATGATVGVACNGDVCTDGQACCLLQDSMSIGCGTPGMGPGMGGGGNACQPGEGYRCDGPEDCMNGQICVGNGAPMGSFGGGTPISTRCRSTTGMNGIVICHTSADCPNAGPCDPQTPIFPGAPTLSTCDPQGL